MTSLSVFVGFSRSNPFMLLGCRHGRIWNRSRNVILNSVFLAVSIFWAIGCFLYDDYEKAGFFMLPTGKKRQRHSVTDYFIQLFGYFASLLPVFTLHAFFLRQ
jgi:protoheme IX farnesyltransferase